MKRAVVRSLGTAVVLGCLSVASAMAGGQVTQLAVRSASQQGGESQALLHGRHTLAAGQHRTLPPQQTLLRQTQASEPTPTPTPTGDPTSPSLGLALNPPTMDLTADDLSLQNTSGHPLSWSISDSAGKLYLDPSSGTLDVGQIQQIKVSGLWPRVDGHYSTVITAVAEGYQAVSTMDGTLDAAPAVGNMHTRDDALCTGGWTYAFAGLYDVDPITDVWLTWTVYDGTGTVLSSGTKPMYKLPDGAGNGGNYRGKLGPIAMDDPGAKGYLVWSIRPTDANGKAADSRTMLASVDNCRYANESLGRDREPSPSWQAAFEVG